MKTESVGRPSAVATSDSGPRFGLFDSRDLGAFGALLLTILAFFWPMIRPWPPRWYVVAGDFSEQFFPFRAFEAKEWWAKRIPLWNPDMFAGHPFQADIQTAVFYPIAMANAILFGRHGFPFFALEGEIVFHTLLAGVFTYLLARVLISSRLGSLLAAVTFALSGFITSYPAQQLPLLETAIWLPLIVLFLELSARRRGDWRWLMAASLAFAVALLAGHTQTGLFIIYSTEGYLLWRCWQQRISWRRTLLSVVAYPTVSLFLAAIQILPTLAFLPVSTRDHLSYLVAAHGYALTSLPEILVPLWHGEKALSIGSAALLLAILGAWVSRREALGYWIIAGLVAIPLSTGGATPLFWVLYHVAPGWNLFRDQERTIYVFAFAGALFAGRGVAELERRAHKSGGARGWAIAAVVGAASSGVLYLLGPTLGAVPPLRTNLLIDTLALAVSALALGVLGVQRLPRWGVPAFLLIVVTVEAFTINFGNNLSPVSPDPRPRLAATAAFVDKLPEPFRVRGISEDVFPSDYGSIIGMPTIGGNTPFEIRRMRDMLQANADWRVWQILNVKYFISNGGPLAGLKLVFQDGPLKTYFMSDSLPRAWAVRAVEVAHTPDEAKQMIMAPGYHPGNIVVLEKPPSIGPFVPGKRPEVKITHLDPQRVEIDATGDGNAMLVLADQYYADWHAYRDGQSVPTFRANYLATAVELPPGQHHFVFVYQPTSLYIGAAISLLTLLALLVAGAWTWRKGAA